MKVLLVDDSTTMRRIQQNQLNELGITSILHAGDGKQALDVLQRNGAVDIVLLDWNMPVMDGLTCLTNIRKEEAYKAMKVVMCTSESEKSRVLEALKAGANNYIVKPFSKDVLRDKLGLRN